MTAEPRTVEEIRADVEAMTGRDMGESLSAAHRLTDDVEPLLARLAAADRENADLRAQLAAAQAQLAEAREKYLAWVRAARLEERAEAEARLEAVRAATKPFTDESQRVAEQIIGIVAAVDGNGEHIVRRAYAGQIASAAVLAALSAAPQPEPDEVADEAMLNAGGRNPEAFVFEPKRPRQPEPETKTAAELLREIAKRDPDGHKAALGRAYGLGRDPANYPDPGGAN